LIFPSFFLLFSSFFNKIRELKRLRKSLNFHTVIRFKGTVSWDEKILCLVSLNRPFKVPVRLWRVICQFCLLCLHFYLLFFPASLLNTSGLAVNGGKRMQNCRWLAARHAIPYLSASGLRSHANWTQWSSRACKICSWDYLLLFIFTHIQ